VVVRDLATAREIGGMRLGDFANQRYGAPYWFVARADLHTALLDAVRSHPAVRLKVGRTCLSVRHGPDEVELVCRGEGGAEDTLQADLLVGADGLWSRVRAALGDDRTPVASGFVAYRATIARPAVPATFGGNEGGLWLGPGRHLVHYPVGADRAVNVVAVKRRPGALPDWSNAVDPGRVQAAFARAAAPVRELIGAASAWSAWSLHDLPVGRMTGDRTALIGDAAHAALPFLAQGGALAIEDAASLAAAIGRTPGDVPRALARFGAARRGRAARVQSGARRNARIYHTAGPIALARNLAMRRLGPEGMTRRYDWIYGHPAPA
jgi:salicylate hydroxylase